MGRAFECSILSILMEHFCVFFGENKIIRLKNKIKVSSNSSFNCLTFLTVLIDVTLYHNILLVEL